MNGTFNTRQCACEYNCSVSDPDGYCDCQIWDTGLLLLVHSFTDTDSECVLNFIKFILHYNNHFNFLLHY